MARIMKECALLCSGCRRFSLKGLGWVVLLYSKVLGYAPANRSEVSSFLHEAMHLVFCQGVSACFMGQGE